MTAIGELRSGKYTGAAGCFQRASRRSAGWLVRRFWRRDFNLIHYRNGAGTGLKAPGESPLTSGPLPWPEDPCKTAG